MPAKSEQSAGVAMEAAIVLFGCAATFGGFHLWKHGVEEPFLYGVVISIPAGATAVFMMASWILPGLVPVARMKFPLNFTLPIVFSALLLMVVTLLSRFSAGSLVQTPEAIRLVEFWSEPRVLLLTFVGQILSLSILALLRSDNRPER